MTGEDARPPSTLSIHELGEHFVRVDGDEQALAFGQHFAFLVENFGGVGMIAPAHADFPRLDTQWFVQWNGLQIVDGDGRSQRDDVAKLIHLAHGFVEEGGDNAAVHVAGRAGIALTEPKTADKKVTFFIVGEAQAHAFGVVLPTGETDIFLQTDVTSTMTVAGRFLRHAAVILS